MWEVSANFVESATKSRSNKELDFLFVSFLQATHSERLVS